MKQKLKTIAKKAVLFVANPRLLLCFGLAWMLTNGWAYILLASGTIFQNAWMIGISTAYLGFLWLPCTPEKLITIPVAIFLLKFLFPNDKNTLALLEAGLQKIKNKLKRK